MCTNQAPPNNTADLMSLQTARHVQATSRVYKPHRENIFNLGSKRVTAWLWKGIEGHRLADSCIVTRRGSYNQMALLSDVHPLWTLI